MKKMISLLMVLMLFSLPLAAIADSIDLSSLTDEALTDLRESIDAELASRKPTPETPDALLEGDLRDYHVAVLSAELDKDYKGEDCLTVTFSWSHNVDDSKSFAFSFGTKLFQGGIECKDAMMMGKGDSHYTTEIKAGPTIEVKHSYLLSSTTEPAELEISELFNFTSSEKLTYVFDLPM